MFFKLFKRKTVKTVIIDSNRVALAIKPKCERIANARWNGGTVYNGNVAAIR